MCRRNHRRQRVKYAGHSPRAQLRIDSANHELEVVRKIFPSMVFDWRDRVAPVIAHVEYHDLVAVAQLAPKRKVSIDGESVAVTHYKARRAVLAVLTHPDCRVIARRDLERMARGRNVRMRV